VTILSIQKTKLFICLYSRTKYHIFLRIIQYNVNTYTCIYTPYKYMYAINDDASSLLRCKCRIYNGIDVIDLCFFGPV